MDTITVTHIDTNSWMKRKHNFHEQMGRCLLENRRKNTILWTKYDRSEGGQNVTSHVPDFGWSMKGGSQALVQQGGRSGFSVFSESIF